MPLFSGDDDSADVLPRPFYGEPWPVHTAAAARAMWDWHLGLYYAAIASVDAAIDATRFRTDAERAVEGAALQSLPDSVTSAAYKACGAHALSRELLAEQVRAAERWAGPIRFRDQQDFEAFIRGWAIPHARLLARLADAAHSWHLRSVDNFARGLFLVGRLACLADDIRSDRIFIPMSDLEQAGVVVEELQTGRITEPMRKLLWKQIIRARDALAQGVPLANEVAPRFSRSLKRYWMGSLELMNEIERRDYDLWSSPLTLSYRHRLQVRFQARFGRTTFRVR